MTALLITVITMKINISVLSFFLRYYLDYWYYNDCFYFLTLRWFIIPSVKSTTRITTGEWVGTPSRALLPCCSTWTTCRRPPLAVRRPSPKPTTDWASKYLPSFIFCLVHLLFLFVWKANNRVFSFINGCNFSLCKQTEISMKLIVVSFIKYYFYIVVVIVDNNFHGFKVELYY